MIKNATPNIINYVDDIIQLCPIGTSKDTDSDYEEEAKGAMLTDNELLLMNILEKQMQELEKSMQLQEPLEEMTTNHISQELIRNFAKCCTLDDLHFELPKTVQDLDKSLNDQTVGLTDVIKISPQYGGADSLVEYLKG